MGMPREYDEVLAEKERYCKWCKCTKSIEAFDLIKTSKIKRKIDCSKCTATLATPYGKQKLDKNNSKHTTPCMLYYIKIITKDGSLPDVWKVGVTSKSSVYHRYGKKELGSTVAIDVIKTWNFPSYFEAIDAERHAMEFYFEHHYRGKSPLLLTGINEMFTIDVLNL